MKPKLSQSKTLTLFIILLHTVLLVRAQGGLSNVQKNSLQAPKDLKIDGYPNEWNNKFQAYNTSTGLFYTMCNNNRNLYLTIQIKDPLIITKVLSSGIQLTLNRMSKKDNHDAIIINYPVFEGNQKPLVALKKEKPQTSDDSARVVNTAIEVMKANNKQLTAKSKYIAIKGVTGIDTLISIYNENNIIGAQSMDVDKVYTWEISLPLKTLGIAANKQDKFAYEIRLPGADHKNMAGVAVQADSKGIPTAITISAGTFIPPKSQMLELMADTYFWGEYTLAKAP